MFFTIYGHGGHLGHVTWTIYKNLRSSFLRMLHMKFGFDWPAVSEKEIFEIVDDDDDGRRRRSDDGAWRSYKLTFSAFGSGELIIKCDTCRLTKVLLELLAIYSIFCRLF